MAQYSVNIGYKKRLPIAYACEGGSTSYLAHLKNLNGIYSTNSDNKMELEIQKNRDQIYKTVRRARQINIKAKYPSLDLGAKRSASMGTLFNRLSSAIVLNIKKDKIKVRKSSPEKAYIGKMLPDKKSVVDLSKKYLKTENFRSDESPFTNHHIKRENKNMVDRINKLKPLYETKRLLKEGDKQRSYLKLLSTSHLSDRISMVPKGLKSDLATNKLKTLTRQLKVGTSHEPSKITDLYDPKSKYSATNIRVMSAITQR